jgi:acyl-CoA reductase-like NAD-dependent aldehyde dehydrogenase
LEIRALPAEVSGGRHPGAGESGMGREHGETAMENLTEPKAVWLALE